MPINWKPSNSATKKQGRPMFGSSVLILWHHKSKTYPIELIGDKNRLLVRLKMRKHRNQLHKVGICYRQVGYHVDT